MARLQLTGTLTVLLLALTASAQDSRVAKFSAIAAKNGGVIPLNNQLYDELVGHGSAASSPRNYTASIILTALPAQFGCKPCRDFDRAHSELAKQWRAKSKKGKAVDSTHFFGVLDFPNGQDVFRRLGLNTAPVGQLWLPAGSQPIQYDFNRNGAGAEPFAAWISENTGLPVTYSKPIDYGKVITAAVTVAGIGSATFIFWNVVKVFLLSRWLWAVASLAFILPMISGYMWNQIRHPPYMQVDQQGKPNYIAGGYSNQYAVETQIISVIYGVLAFATYTLTVTLPNLSNDKVRQRIGVYLWTAVTLVMASVLVAIFTIKNPGYPYRLLF